MHVMSVWLAHLVKSLAAPTHFHSCVQEVRVSTPEQNLLLAVRWYLLYDQRDTIIPMYLNIVFQNTVQWDINVLIIVFQNGVQRDINVFEYCVPEHGPMRYQCIDYCVPERGPMRYQCIWLLCSRMQSNEIPMYLIIVFQNMFIHRELFWKIAVSCTSISIQIWLLWLLKARITNRNVSICELIAMILAQITKRMTQPLVLLDTSRGWLWNIVCILYNL